MFTTAIQAQINGMHITMYPAPTAYCLSTNQNEIILSGSDKTVSYQLCMVDTTGKKIAVGMPVKGTGHSLTIPVEEQGVYVMEGLSDHGCSTEMTGSVRIIEKSLQTDILSSIMPPNGNYVGSVYMPTSTPTTEENIVSSFDVRDGIVVGMFIAIFFLIIYGIKNILSKKNLYSTGDYKEMRPPWGEIPKKKH